MLLLNRLNVDTYIIVIALLLIPLSCFGGSLEEVRKKAINGDVNAQHNLGVMFEKGEGVSQNFKEAAKWYLKSAKQGYAIAQNNLGVLYENGDGVLQNYGEAIKWYLKSAAQGHAAAQSNLGVMYVNGFGMPQDYVKARALFHLAAAKGYKNGRIKKNIVSSFMTKEQIAKAETLAKTSYNLVEDEF